jgi:hypothetical protein
LAIFQAEANAFADALAAQYEYIDQQVNDLSMRDRYIIQLRDDTIAIANVVHALGGIHVDMDEFYERAGYQGTHPQY